MNINQILRLASVLGLTLFALSGAAAAKSDSLEFSPPPQADIGGWANQHGLDDWPIDWYEEIQSMYEVRWIPAALIDMDLERARFGRMRGERVVAIVVSCSCSSSATSVHVYSEGGARLVLEVDDTITDVAFKLGQLQIAYEDDPHAANCCAEWQRRKVWDLAGNQFVEMSSEREPTRRR